MKQECPLARCEPLTALAILRGDLSPPDRELDPNPFQTLTAYVIVRCPRWTAPVHAAPEANEDCHYSPELADVLCIAHHIVADLVAPNLSPKQSIINTALTRVREFRDYCLKVESDLKSKEYEFNFEIIEKIYSDLIRLRQHCDIALAETGDRGALEALARDAEAYACAGDHRYLPFAIGARSLLTADGLIGFPWRTRPLGSIRRAITTGQSVLVRAEADKRATKASPAAEAPDAPDEAPEDYERAGIVRLKQVTPPGVVVFPASSIEAAGKGSNQSELKRFLGDRAGRALPLVPVPEDWHAWEQELVSEAPWLAPAIRAVRASQGGRTHWGGGAVCLDGAPGAGKSRLARRIAEVSGLPFTRVQLDSTSDNSSLAGTPLRWVSAHPGLIERMLAEAGKASGMALIDEIEKGSGSRRNGAGDPLDTLHGLLEAETARSWTSPYTLSQINVSHVFYVCTANETQSLPSSLRDRMRVIRCAEPGPEHLGLLAAALTRHACRELGLDERWATLDGEELSVLAEAWPGGSVRRLARLVEGLLQARDGAPVARH